MDILFSPWSSSVRLLPNNDHNIIIKLCNHYDLISGLISSKVTFLFFQFSN